MKKEMKSLVDLISLKGKTALVTGAAVGIGKAISIRFGEAGADLVLVDINEEGLEQTKEEILKFKVGVKTHRVDLSKREDIENLWKGLEGEEPDILVNNAGVYSFRDFLELDEDFFEKTMRVNLYSALWMSQEMIRRRGKKGGVIINVGSIEAILPFAKNLVHYDISKMGVIALTRALAREYGKQGFRVNAVIPGGIETERVKELKKKGALKFDVDLMKIAMDFKSRLPLGRFGMPDEVARVVVILASDVSSYVHGALVPVDGGFLST